MSRWYNLVSHLDKNAEIIFMNFGYSSEELKIDLDPEKEPDRYAIQNYYQIADKVEIIGKDILEVGCGRGGGIDFITRHFRPRTVAAVDLSPKAISFCKKYYNKSGINFTTANAENLPFDDGSFDVVINVESSHIYGDMQKFLSEVKRVLKPGGHLVITDFRRRHRIDDLMEDIANCGMFKKIEENITSRVIEALHRDDQRKRGLVKRLAPRLLHVPALHFAAVKDSRHFNYFVSGEMQYFNFVLENRD